MVQLYNIFSLMVFSSDPMNICQNASEVFSTAVEQMQLWLTH